MARYRGPLPGPHSGASELDALVTIAQPKVISGTPWRSMKTDVAEVGASKEESAMIIRFWRAVAGSDAVLDTYADHLRRTTFAEMAELPGHLGATLARKVKGTDNELVVVSLWEDLASAAHFQKGDFDDAVVKPSTQTLLKSFDLKVEYFETLVSTGVVSDEARRSGG